MAENQVQIEVELVGQKEVGQGLDKITKGAEGLGETFKGVGGIVGKTNQQLGEGLSSVSDALGETMNAVGGIKEAFTGLGQGGAMSFTSLLGPIGLAVTAVGALYEAYRQLSGAAKEAEDRQEAMAAAAGDLSSKLEALAEGGVVPTTQQLERFAKITLETQVAKELLIKKTEKLFPILEKERKAQQELTEAQAHVVKTQQEYGKGSSELTAALQVQYRAEADLAQVQGERAKKTAELAQQTAQNLAGIAAAAEQEKTLEEQTTDNLRAKFKENAERLKTVELLRLEAMQVEELLSAQAKDNIETEHTILLLGLEDKSRAELIEMIKGQTDAVEALREEEAIREASAARQAKLEADNLKKIREERAKAAQEAKVRREAEAKAAAAELQQRLALQSQINLLELQLTTQGDEQKIKMAQERYRLGLELAKDDAMKRAVVEKAYQLEIKKLGEERATREAQQAEERIRQEREVQKAIIDAEIERQQFDIEHRQIREGDLAAETQKQLDALGLRYAQEIIMAEGNQERITELTRRANIERTEIERAQVVKRAEMVNGALDQYGKGFAQAAAAALLTSKTMGEAFKAVLDGLAMEATVEALMETAKGTAALFLNPAAAATHFKAAAIFGGAAAVAGGLSASIPKGGGGGTNRAQPTSPSGLPQTSSAPARETAQSSQITYNVNFGGAVVYDTKRAAEMALTQRIDRRRGEMRGAR
jgi:hypothetical protein